MYPNKQDKNQKLRKVQGLYRKKRQKNTEADDKMGILGTTIVTICLILFSIFFIMSVLFDMGVSVPEIFGR